ncbi:hypothetical protein LZ31DRAFT_391265 [Colletotrichum somersetense]|nr:hypothetical protein LZ31DRAFT_391265 [Colletotrichum somersetense]
MGVADSTSPTPNPYSFLPPLPIFWFLFFPSLFGFFFFFFRLVPRITHWTTSKRERETERETVTLTLAEPPALFDSTWVYLTHPPTCHLVETVRIPVRHRRPSSTTNLHPCSDHSLNAPGLRCETPATAVGFQFLRLPSPPEGGVSLPVCLPA